MTARLQSESITETSGRTGTHHTTHFLVTFTTLTGEQVATQVDAHGRYQELPPGSIFQVRYDPASPRHAELPGAPMDSLASALIITIIAVVGVLTGVSIARGVVRNRRRRQRHEPVL